jgi:hypothetical protein
LIHIFPTCVPPLPTLSSRTLPDWADAAAEEEGCELFAEKSGGVAGGQDELRRSGRRVVSGAARQAHRYADHPQRRQQRRCKTRRRPHPLLHTSAPAHFSSG